jgi:hypothetical protein
MLTTKAYDNHRNFPHYVGALDGKHPLIQSPIHGESEFITHKGTFTVLMVVPWHMLVFVYLSTSDARVE